MHFYTTCSGIKKAQSSLIRLYVSSGCKKARMVPSVDVLIVGNSIAYFELCGYRIERARKHVRIAMLLEADTPADTPAGAAGMHEGIPQEELLTALPHRHPGALRSPYPRPQLSRRSIRSACSVKSIPSFSLLFSLSVTDSAANIRNGAFCYCRRLIARLFSDA